MIVTLGQQYNVGEKPAVILDTYINRHAKTLFLSGNPFRICRFRICSLLSHQNVFPLTRGCSEGLVPCCFLL